MGFDHDRADLAKVSEDILLRQEAEAIEAAKRWLAYDRSKSDEDKAKLACWAAYLLVARNVRLGDENYLPLESHG